VCRNSPLSRIARGDSDRDNSLVRIRVVCVGLLALTACGLSVTGSPLEDADGGVNAPASDGGGGSKQPDAASSEDGAVPPSPADCANPCSLPSAPGFTVALFGDTTQTCPSGFTGNDVVENPTPGSDACACGDCSATIDCSNGSLLSHFDNGNGSCSMSGATVPANNGACQELAATFGRNASIDAPNAVVGACSAAGVASRAAVTTQAKRVCVPPASADCAGIACAASATLKTCLAADGDVACPANAPTKHLVGADFSLSCADCSCQVTATCGGKLDAYSKKNCPGMPAVSLTAGVCTPTMGGADVAAVKWTGSVASQSCTKGAAPAPAVSLTGPRTICCL
jgi:hypothetical protein